MNKFLTLTLFGLAFAAHQAKQATATTATAAKAAKAATKAKTDVIDAGDAPMGDAAGSENAYGYEAPADENYAAPATYAAPMTYAVKKAPSICYTGQCNRNAPCYSFATGTCSAMVAEAYAPAYAASYSAPMAATYSAPTEESGYRRLQQFANPNVRLHCPPGTVDSYNWGMHKQTVLWVGFGFLFLPALCFLWRSFEQQVAARRGNAGKGSTKPAPGKGSTKPAPGNGVDFAEVTNVRINAGMVNMVASLAYLAMATKHGYTTRCNGRDFYYARYVDWIITTPLMLYDLAVIGGTDTNTRIFLCGIDIIMIVSGLIGSLVEDSGAGLGGTNEKWGFFGFSMLCFIPVIYFLCANNGDGKQTLLGTLCNGLGVFCSSNTSNEPRAKTYQRAMNLTVMTWIVYPIIWILAEGTETISVEGENIAYTVLDILSKSVFGWILVFQNWHIAAGAVATTAASSVL